jgi:hypothetical protein
MVEAPPCPQWDWPAYTEWATLIERADDPGDVQIDNLEAWIDRIERYCRGIAEPDHNVFKRIWVWMGG